MFTRLIQRKRPRRYAVLAISAGVLVIGLVAAAALAQILGDTGTVNVIVGNRSGLGQGTTAKGAVVQYIGDSNESFGSSGTGTFDPFLRLQGSPTEKGYNTSGTTEFDTKVGTWTHAIRVSHIPVVDCLAPTTGKCWELFVDINENNSTPYLSLNKVQVFYTDNANLTGYATFSSSPPSGTSLQYSFAGDILIKDVNQGSGRGDLRYDIPLASGGDTISIPSGCAYNPNDTTCSTFFLVYSEWGSSASNILSTSHDYSTDGGFEEWQVHIYTPTSVTTTLHETNSSGTDVSPANNGTTISVFPNAYVTDYASVTPSTATGSVAFKYYGSLANCNADTSGTPAGSGSVSSGSAHSSTVQFTSPGTFYWRAFFTSNTGSVLSSSSDCSEAVTVFQIQPTLTTAQTVKITDSATISATGGGNLSGTAHFRPFSDAGCTTTPLAVQEDVSVSGASPQTASATTIVTFNTAGNHLVYWQVSYTSSNPAQKDIAATCTENTNLTITN